jgi:hypothetical protein
MLHDIPVEESKINNVQTHNNNASNKSLSLKLDENGQKMNVNPS